jgi:polygalacturonase
MKHFLHHRFAVSLLVAVLMPAFQSELCTAQDNGWDRLPTILSRIVAPVFPEKDFDITSYGAVADGKTDCTSAIAAAVDACTAAGGGRVIVPAGNFKSGAIHLRSNVNLHLLKGSTILFDTDPHKYLPVVYCRWEGVECMNYSPLIYAFEQQNIAVTGEGVLDAQASEDNWWSWKGGANSGKPNQAEARKKLNAMGEKNVPVKERIFGEGAYLRPNFFEPYRCKNILVQGVTFRNSPMWFLNPVLCSNVSVLDVTTIGQGPNNDGCDPESCTDVLMRNCFFDNGDDCIAIKSGRNNDGRRVNVPCENIIVQSSTMKNGHGGVSIGSEVSGNVRNVFIEDCSMDSPLLDRALRIKTNAVRGGIVEQVYMRNVKVGQVAEAVVKVDFYYEEAEKGNFLPIVRNVSIENVTCAQSKFGIWIRAFAGSPASDISIRNCSFLNAAKPDVVENVKNLTLINVKSAGAKE